MASGLPVCFMQLVLISSIIYCLNRGRCHGRPDAVAHLQQQAPGHSWKLDVSSHFWRGERQPGSKRILDSGLGS